MTLAYGCPSLFKRYCDWCDKPIDFGIVRYKHRDEILPLLTIGLLLAPIFVTEYWLWGRKT